MSGFPPTICFDGIPSQTLGDLQFWVSQSLLQSLKQYKTLIISMWQIGLTIREILTLDTNLHRNMHHFKMPLITLNDCV